MSESDFTNLRIFFPITFLRLEFAEKNKYIFGCLVFSVFSSIVFYFLPVKPSLIINDGILNDIQDLCAILFPFLVASLVAVSTLSRDGLDDRTVGSPVKINVKHQGLVSLSRREFVCVMFSFSAMVCFLIFLSILISKIFAKSFVGVLPYEYVDLAKSFYFLFFSFMFSVLTVFTFWGMYYVSYKIFR